MAAQKPAALQFPLHFIQFLVKRIALRFRMQQDQTFFTFEIENVFQGNPVCLMPLGKGKPSLLPQFLPARFHHLPQFPFRLLLQQIAKGPDFIALSGILCQAAQKDNQALLSFLPQGSGSFQAVQPRHPDIQEENVIAGCSLFTGIQKRLTALKFLHPDIRPAGKIVLYKQFPQTLPENLLIITDCDIHCHVSPCLFPYLCSRLKNFSRAGQLICSRKNFPL